MESEKNKIFIEKFNLEKYDFFDATPFVNVEIGFSVKKKLKDRNDDYVTLLSIYISKRVSEIETTKKLLSIRATYGKEAEGGGVFIRENPKYNDPIDCEFPNEYFYDIKTKDLYKNNKIISANDLIEEVYNEHIKSTKLIKGFLIKIKMWFWRVAMKNIFEYLARFFSFLLFIISGNHHDPRFKDEIWRPDVSKNELEEPNKKPGEKISFLGYKATPECILFYSLLHFLLYLVFIYINYQPMFITKMFKNNFLTLIYVMFSLIIIDKVAPKILIRLIDDFSEKSFNFLYKTIKL